MWSSYMTSVEHYFENLLFHGKDAGNDDNKKMLTKQEQAAVESCADYVLNNIFYGRIDFKRYMNDGYLN